MKIDDFIDISSENFNQYITESAAMAIHEALGLRRDTENNMLAVVSNEDDPKKARQETYNNRQLLKNAGFKWMDGAWKIADSEFNKAKDIITKVNKTEYLINKLEDVKEFVSTKAEGSAKDQLNAKLNEYIKSLANATDEAAASEEIRKYLNFFSKFHQYSFYNRILIYIQRPDATRVASFKKWKETDRQVKKGAKGIAILVPIFRKGENPMSKESDDDDGNGNHHPISYRIGYVFDISDTQAISDRGEVPSEPEWWGNNEPSETADRLFELVKAAAESEGLDITSDEGIHGEKGYSKGGHINITSDVEGVGRVSTMVHEYAHELMHHKDQSKYYIGDEDIRNRALKELQAESVSYVVLKHYDLPVEHHTKYLALWRANSAKIRHNIEIISKVAHHIIRAIEKQADKQKSS